MNMLSKRQKIIIIVFGVFVSLIVGYYYISSTRDLYNTENFVSQVLDEDIEESEEEVEKTIVVHVTGEVNKQGIVKVKENARINDVIEAAGGLTDKADLSKVNLAYMVEDGQKIYIPYEREGDIEDKEIITNSSGYEILEEDKSDNNLGIININTATKEKLMQIPGIRRNYCVKHYYI